MGKYICECMDYECEYVEECTYPPVYCKSHFKANENGELVEVKEYIRGRHDMVFSFKNMCKRDNFLVNQKWHEGLLIEFLELMRDEVDGLKIAKNYQFIPGFDVLKKELQEIGLWKD